MLEKITWLEFIKISSPQYYVLLVTHAGGRSNLTGISWYSVISWEPQLVMVSLRRQRFAYELIRKNPEFVVCFPASEQLAGAALCGQQSGRKDDKVAAAGFKLLPATKVDVPLVEGSTACLECILRNEYPAGDHQLLIGEVLALHGDFQRTGHLYTTAYKEIYGLDYEIDQKKP